MMYFPTIIILAASAFVANVAAGSVTHTVTVGDLNGDLMFKPPIVHAKVGDFVTYEFKQKNHSATQSESFFQPCTNKQDGFDSGFHPVAPNVTENLPTFTVSITDKFTKFVHCRQGENTNASHCGQGMVHIINPFFGFAEFELFKLEALAVGDQLGVPQKP